MTMTDPIADFLTRVRNAINAAHETVEVPASNQKVELARILKEQGYIDNYDVKDIEVGRLLTVHLKYTDDRRPAIAGLKRVSKPGRRIYLSSGDIPRVLGGMGTSIVTTSRGMMTGHDAQRQGVGGELVATVW